MSFRRPLVRPEKTLDLTPMSDIIFTLLLFFILSQNFLTSLPVDLPEVHSGEPLPTERFRTIEITASNTILIEGKVLPQAGWEEALGNHLTGLATDGTVVLKADRNSRSGTAVEVIDWLRGRGIRRVALTATPGLPAPPPDS